MLASGAKPSGHVTCANCGEQADSFFSFCTHCGADLKVVIAADREAVKATTDKERNEADA